MSKSLWLWAQGAAPSGAARADQASRAVLRASMMAGLVGRHIIADLVIGLRPIDGDLQKSVHDRERAFPGAAITTSAAADAHAGCDMDHLPAFVQLESAQPARQ